MRKLLLLLLLLAACQFVPQLPFQSKQYVPPDIMKGTSALEISFNSASMSNILMCNEANILVDLKNTGAYNVSGKYVIISEMQFLKPVGDKSGSLFVEGKSLYNPVGGSFQKELRLKSLKMPEQLEVFSTQCVFVACYPYKTFAAAQVCIDTDINNRVPKKACSPEITTFSNGQGAPVAITQVETRMASVGDKVRPMFKLFVQNVGSGSVVSTKDVDSACGAGKDKKLSSEVFIHAFLQGKELKCQKTNLTLMPGQDAYIVCESQDTYGVDAGTFSTLLGIELDYGYVNAAVLPMTVTRAPGQAVCTA